MLPSHHLPPLGHFIWAAFLFLGAIVVTVRSLVKNRMTVLLLPHRRYVERYVQPKTFWSLVVGVVVLGLIGLFFVIEDTLSFYAG